MANTAYNLTHKIVIQYNSNDGTHDPDPGDWKDLYPIFLWAAKKGLTGRMYYQAAASQNNNESIFTVRWTKARADQIRPTMRIIVDGDTNHPLEITSLPVDLDDSHEWLEIHAKDNRQNAG